MKNKIATLPDYREVRVKAIEDILKSLNITKASMLIRENLYQRVDYLEIKDRLFGKLTVEELYEEMAKQRAKGGL